MVDQIEMTEMDNPDEGRGCQRVKLDCRRSHEGNESKTHLLLSGREVKLLVFRISIYYGGTHWLITTRVGPAGEH